MSKEIKVGDVFPTNDGGSVTVKSREKWNRITVEHNDSAKHIQMTTSSAIRTGKIKNPFYRSIYGVGYLGLGEHRAYIGAKQSPAYCSWVGMMDRCYSAKYHRKQPTYIGCSVHQDWHDFQCFAEWFYNKRNSMTAGFALDKDLKVYGNKEYSEETCSFVPQEINNILVDRAALRGKYPIGVCAYKGKYLSQLKLKNRKSNLGCYDTPEEAHNVYKKAKIAHVRSQAEKFRDVLDSDVYIYLSRWSI